MNTPVQASSNWKTGHDKPVFRSVVVVLALLVWFAQLGYRDLVDPDEGRYAEIPREMVASGNWLTPRLDDFKYFEKPPLQYWASAALYRLLGLSNTTARLWPALCGVLGALWVGYVTRRLYGKRSGYYAFLICLSSVLYFFCGHVLTLDMTLTAMLSFALGALLLAQQQRTNTQQCRNWMLVAWVALAAAVLSKGLVALVLPATVVLVYSFWQRDWALWRKLYLGWGLAIVMLIDAPWFITMSLHHKEFAQFFFIHEHFERYLTTVHNRNGPLLYFIPILFFGCLPWSMLSVKSLLVPLRERSDTANWNAERFLWLFVLVVIAFFSFSKSKLPPYILPVFPALAILNARSLTKTRSLLPDAALTAIVAMALFILALNVQRFASDTVPLHALLSVRPWLVAAGVMTFAAALALYGYRRIGGIAVSLAACFIFLASKSLLFGSQSITETRSASDIAAFIEKQGLPSGAPVYLIGEYAPSLAFYLQHPVVIVAKRGELAMGIDAEPEKWIPNRKAFIDKWNAAPVAIAVIDNDNIPWYSAVGLATKPQYHDSRSSIIIKSSNPIHVASHMAPRHVEDL